MKNETILITGITFGMQEFEVMKTAMTGIPRKEMEDALNMPLATINTHLRHIYLKVGVNKITDLIIWGFENGFDSKGNYKRKD